MMNGLYLVGIPTLSLRHLRAMLNVAKYKNLTRASNELGRTQSAITKAICDLEVQLEVKLFDRSATGMQPTVYGDALAKRVAKIEAEFISAGRTYTEYKRGNRDPRNLPIFSMDISYKRLVSFIALYDTRSFAATAVQLGVTKSAIYSSLRQMEDSLDLTLFERRPGGLSSTTFCALLAGHVKLVFSQIRHAVEDIASIEGVLRGHVTLGTLPYSRTILTPRAINRLLAEHPQLNVSTAEGPYSMLETSLRSGDLDFIIGAVRPMDETTDLVTETLFEDRLAVIVSKGHPLEKEHDLCLSDLQGCSWVLPVKNTPSRLLFDSILEMHGLEAPEHIIETSSLSTVRGLLLESNRIALLSEHQIYFDQKFGMLTTLPIELEDTFRPIGVTMRAHTELSPASYLFLRCLRHVATELTNSAQIS